MSGGVIVLDRPRRYCTPCGAMTFRLKLGSQYSNEALTVLGTVAPLAQDRAWARTVGERPQNDDGVNGAFGSGRACQSVKALVQSASVARLVEIGNAR